MKRQETAGHEACTIFIKTEVIEALRLKAKKEDRFLRAVINELLEKALLDERK